MSYCLSEKPGDEMIQKKLYNILINENQKPLLDNEPMKNIDDKEKRFSLLLQKSLFLESFNKNNSTLTFSLSNPPSLSIAEIPVVKNFFMAIKKINRNQIETKVHYDDEKKIFPFISNDADFIKTFDVYVSAKSEQTQLTFFKTVLAKWAQEVKKSVTFQAEPLKATLPVKPSLKTSSWFNWQLPSFQQIKNWFKAKAALIATGVGAATIGGLLYKYRPNWFQAQPTMSHKTSSSMSNVKR